MSESDELDVIVVGAGLAGLAAAWEAAGAGLSVAVLERGDAAGSKNLSGGRLYLGPVREMCGDFLEGAPFEREVVSESVVLTDDASSMTVRLDNGEESANPDSVTVLRSVLDAHLAEKLMEREAMVLPQQKVDGLVMENGIVAGVKIGTEELRARTVVAADGVLSFIAADAGLRDERNAAFYALGFKEILQMDSSVIEDRFNLPEGKGAARLYMGNVTKGMPGGGFIYTNRKSLSVGLVLNIGALKDFDEAEAWELLEEFKNRPDVKPLLKDGKTVEYGAHLIPEGGFDDLPEIGIPGLLLAGDAAGLVLNAGHTLRGMDLALASGILAGRSAAHSHERKLSPIQCLNHYEEALKKSFVYKQMERYSKAPEVLSIRRIYSRYPHQVVKLGNDMFRIDSQGRGMSLWAAVKRLVFRIIGWQGFRDLWKLLRMGR